MPDTQLSSQPTLRGVYAAAVTPLTAELAPDLAALPALLDFLATRGCHGALLLGTTGEGTSFSVDEHIAVFREGLRYRATARPDFRILAGTGAASPSDAATLTRAAFDLGADAVVTLPPFYYKNVSADGLAAYYDTLIRTAVPADG